MRQAAKQLGTLHGQNYEHIMPGCLSEPSSESPKKAWMSSQLGGKEIHRHWNRAASNHLRHQIIIFLQSAWIIRYGYCSQKSPTVQGFNWSRIILLLYLFKVSFLIWYTLDMNAWANLFAFPSHFGFLYAPSLHLFSCIDNLSTDRPLSFKE